MNTYKFSFILGLVLCLLVVPSLASAEVNFTSLNISTVAYYTFDENTGSTAGDSVGTNDGTLITGTDWTSGIINSGVDGEVSFGSVTSFGVGTEAFSISFWFYPNSFQNTIYLTNRQSSGSNRFFLDNDDGNLDRVLRFFTNDGTSTLFTSDNGAYNLNEWNHVVITRSGSSGFIFVNGVEVGSGTLASGNIGSSNDWSFLGRSGQLIINGSGDELAIFDKALSSEEVGFLYASGSPNSNQQYPFVSGNFSFSIVNSWDDSPINDFNYSINGGSIIEVTGGNTVTTDLLSNDTSLYNFSFFANNFFQKNFTNINVSSNEVFSLDQSLITFSAFDIFSGQPISSANFTVNGTSGVNPFPISNGTWQVLAQANNYFNKTKNFNVSFLEVKNVDLLMHDHELNVSVINNSDGGIAQGVFTGYYTNELYLINNSFTINGSKVFHLKSGLDYEFYLDPVGGFATITGLEFNYTSSDSFGSENFTLFQANTLEVNVFDADDPSTKVQTLTNITISNNQITYNLQTTNGSFVLNPIVGGTYKITASNDNYNTRNRFFTVLSGEYQVVNLFLDVGGNPKTFTVIDNGGNVVDDVTLTFSYFVNGSEVTVAQAKTDLSGTTSVVLNEVITYTVTASKQGFNTFSGSLTPFQNSYVINIDASTLNRFDSVFRDVSYRTFFERNNTQDWGLLKFDINSFDGDIQYFGFNTTYNNVVFSDFVSGSPSGGNRVINITGINSTLQKTFTVNYFFKVVGKPEVNFTVTFSVFDFFDEKTNILNIDISNLPTGFKNFVGVLLPALFGIFGILATGRAFGGAIGGGFGLGIGYLLGLYPLMPVLLAVGVLVLLILSDINTGENK